MKLIYILILIGLSSQAAIVNIQTNTGWTDLPYCKGKVRLICGKNMDNLIDINECHVEIVSSKCTKINMYTASTFYPSVWTVFESRNINEDKKIKIKPNHLSGSNNHYFYVFLTTDFNNPYTKIKFNISD